MSYYSSSGKLKLGVRLGVGGTSGVSGRCQEEMETAGLGLSLKRLKFLNFFVIGILLQLMYNKG